MHIILPNNLSKNIDNSISKLPEGNIEIMTHRAKWLVSYLYDKSIRVSGLAGERIGIQAKVLRKKLGRHYKAIIMQLETDSLIHISKGYSDNQTKTYWVDPRYLDGELNVIKINMEIENDLEEITKEILDQYTIDIDLAQEIIKELVNDKEALLKKCELNDEIRQEYFGKIRVYSTKNNNGYEWKTLNNMAKTTLLDKYYEPSFSLIKYNKRLYYVPLDVFLKDRRRKVRYSYLKSVCKIQHKDWNYSKDKNGRIYTNIVNLPSVLIPALRHESNMRIIELDISCCQWVFFIYACKNPKENNLISKFISETRITIDTEDFHKFCQLVKEGTLYDFIAQQLGRKDRRLGKSLTFEILFGKVFKLDSEELKTVRTQFPTVLTLVQSFKKKHGYKTLPNSLQSIEANTIINNILKELYTEGHTYILTKHDSFIFPDIQTNDRPIIDVILNKLNDTLGDIFNYKVKTYPHNVARVKDIQLV